MEDSGALWYIKTPERHKHSYYWDIMEEDVIDYIRACDTYQRDKPSRHHRHGQLLPPEVLYQSWSSVCMNWIVDLLDSNVYIQICIIVGRFPKMAYQIP